MIDSRLLFDVSDVSQEDVTALQEKIKAESRHIGYYSLVENYNEELIRIYEFVFSNSFLYKKKIKHLVIIGIGGSSLGTKAVDAALKHTKNRNDINLIFLEYCDSNVIKESLRDVTAQNAFFLIVSKSGGTIETASLTKYVLDKYFHAVSSSKRKKRFAVITDKGSPLDLFAQHNDIYAFYITDNVGGRFSVLSVVGLVPLALLGYNIKKLLDGAAKVKRRFFGGDNDDIVKKALFYAKNRDTLPINVLFSYSGALAQFNAWYVQLWAESLGKIDHSGQSVGLTPIGLVGSVDQHSFLQLIMQGVRNKSVTFVKVKNFQNNLKIPELSIPELAATDYVNSLSFADVLNAQCEATFETLAERGIPVDLIELGKLDESNIGALLFYFELLTSLVGAAFDINTYDQPGVEFGKQRLREKLAKK